MRQGTRSRKPFTLVVVKSSYQSILITPTTRLDSRLWNQGKTEIPDPGQVVLGRENVKCTKRASSN